MSGSWPGLCGAGYRSLRDVYLINVHFHTVYRAQFPFTMREIHEDTKSDRKTVIPAVILLSAFGVWASMYLRDTSKGNSCYGVRLIELLRVWLHSCHRNGF